ncbi:hypothetical protein WOLCODRAFT_146238 [Wolfiporia cocos MD-104 SS10]|uniref:DUF6534 domain-containing protein n=1 Tax=Wolfiporia cocos (strain MD-104) TaxID=742152 RepID=A0A2H3JK53_WOLCO|nr:hypothetical protein WOLCODRAFT_146238 [Wolfiporia cocos MD-104 SS10]
MDVKVPSLNVLFGPEFVGMSIAWACYGGTLGQTMFYYHNYSKDNLVKKSMVASLLVLDTLKAGGTGTVLWSELVARHGDFFGALAWMNGGYVVWMTSALTICIVQSFYIHAIWKLLNGRSHRIPLTCAAMVLVVTGLASAIAFVYEVHRDSSNVDASLARVMISGRMQSVMDLAVNAYITVTLSVILHKSRSEQQQTGITISKLITYTVNRGIVLFVLQLLEISLYNAQGHWDSILSEYFFYPISTVNANTILIALNMRHYVNELENGDQVTYYSEAISDFEARVPSAKSAGSACSMELMSRNFTPLPENMNSKSDQPERGHLGHETSAPEEGPMVHTTGTAAVCQN